MIEVVQAFDRAPTTRLPSDDQAALERKIVTARQVSVDRGQWLEPIAGSRFCASSRLSCKPSASIWARRSRAKAASR